jgi:hypothetical protein
MKERDIPKLGKLGNTVTYQTRYGQVTRRLVTPRDPKNSVQVNRRAAFGRARFLWRTITDDQRAAWNRTARGRRTRRTLNQSGHLSGYLLFIKLNPRSHKLRQGYLFSGARTLVRSNVRT